MLKKSSSHLIAAIRMFALIVDGKPFTMLGVQAHNSSNYPGALDKVWGAG